MLAIKQNSIDVANYVDDQLHQTSLFFAAVINEPQYALEVTKYLVENNVVIDYSDINSQTALYYYAREGKTECCKYLHEKGANVNFKDNNLQTPLFYAAREGNTELVGQLIEWGADVNAEDNKQETAFFYAVNERKTETCKLMIEKNAKCDTKNKRNQSPLMIAKRNKSQEIINLLLSKGLIDIPSTTITNKTSKKNKSKISKKLKKIKEKQTFILSKYANNQWVPMNEEEAKKFHERYPYISQYINDPNSLDLLHASHEITPENTMWQPTANKILQALWKINGAEIFHEPVDANALQIPDYPEIVKCAMDFKTIKGKLTATVYKSVNEFCTDIELVFSNCILYNGEETSYSDISNRLRDEFHKLCEKNKLCS